jgi:type III secretion protein J
MTLRHLVLASALLALTACSVELHHELNEQDANDIYVLLSEHGIGSTKIRDESGNQPTYLIRVPKQDAAQASRLLKEYSLPRPSPAGLSIFAKSKGMIPTQTEERAMFLEALGGEVASALNKVDGVLEARAIINIPPGNDLTSDEKPKPSASVLIKYRPIGEGQIPLSDADIREFVARAVPEMDQERVKVLLTQSLPPSSYGTRESQLKDVFGMRMTASSANAFRVMVALCALVIMAMAGYMIWGFTRGGSAPAAGRPRPRPRPEA